MKPAYKWLFVTVLLLIMNITFYGEKGQTDQYNLKIRKEKFRIGYHVDDTQYTHFARDFILTFLIFSLQVAYYRKYPTPHITEESIVRATIFAMVAFILGFEFAQSRTTMFGIIDFVIGITAMNLSKELAKRIFKFS